VTSFERVFSGANSDATVVIQGWLASDYREMNRCQRGEELTMIPKVGISQDQPIKFASNLLQSVHRSHNAQRNIL
jgi:hypothetical protein